jgi:ELWxxDGT repeat protein
MEPIRGIARPKTSPRAIGILFVVWAAAAPADAWWIKHCGYKYYWQSNTQIVADINPGPANALSSSLLWVDHRNYSMAAYNGTLYFEADDGVSGGELWKVDGGPSSQVADLVPGSTGSTPHSFAVFQGKLFFAANTPSTGEELFVFDGAAIGLAAEMEAGPEGGEIAGLTEYAGRLYFTRYSAAKGHQVWRFDGSSAVPVAAINALSGKVEPDPSIANVFVVFQDRLYFVRKTPSDQYELWAYDGSGVSSIKTLSPPMLLSGFQFDMGVYQNALYFGVMQLDSPTSDHMELWKYSGQGQPVEVGVVHPYYGAVGFFQEYKGNLYFSVDFTDLYRFDGTSLEQLPPQPGNYTAVNLSPFPAAGRLFWSASAGPEAEHTNPYIFDGWTWDLLQDIWPDKPEEASCCWGSSPSSAVEAGGRLYFYAFDQAHGRELWRVTGTNIGPFLECDIVVAPIWEKWWEWPVEVRDVVIATWVVDPNASARLVSREAVTVTRGKQTHLPVYQVDPRRADSPEAFVLASLVFDRATGEKLDRGFGVVGVPAQRERRLLERAAERLLLTRSFAQVLAEPLSSEKASARRRAGKESPPTARTGGSSETRAPEHWTERPRL